MTTEEVVNEAAAEPAIDTASDEQAKLDAQLHERQEQEQAAYDRMEDNMQALRDQEAAIAAEQDAALAAVKAECDEFRAALPDESI